MLDLADLKFAQKEMDKTLAKSVNNTEFIHIKNTITEIFADTRMIPYCEEHHGKMYHFFQSDDYPKGVYRVCRTKDFRIGLPKWKILFNVQDFDDLLTDDVFLENYVHYVENPDLMLLFLSSQGQDLCYTIEFDLNSKQILTNGFNLPLSKSFIHYRDNSSCWVCPAWQEFPCNNSGYAKEVWLWQRGQSFAEATLIFKDHKDTLFVEAWRYLDAHGSPLDIIKQYHSFNHYSYHVIDKNLKIQKLNLPAQCDICGYLHGYVLIHLKQVWQHNQKNYTAGTILALKLKKGLFREFIEVFKSQPNQVIEDIEISKDYIFIHYLDHVISQVTVFKFSPKLLQKIAFPNFNTCNFELIDQPWRSNLFYFVTNDLIHEPVLYTWDADKKELCVLRRQKPLFNLENIQLSQFWATSEDKTNIPYFWCGKTQSLNTPTLIYCYGGFAINELPHYLPVVGKLWLEQGGAFVIANIRGGAELGESWHTQALKTHKEKSIEDLLAVINDLQTTQKTSANFTAIQGGSHGGLMVANAMVRNPEKLRCIICETPLLDMSNFIQYGSGQLWIDEYGNPEFDDDLAILKKLTVFDKIKSDINYPDLLITTSKTDDRVDPIHSIKLHKIMLKNQHHSCLYFDDIGGHESINSQNEQINQLAYQWFFLYNALNLTFQPT